MGNFRWLHISDLHFARITQYPIADIRDSFYKKLREIQKERPFDCVFITGDIADKNDYQSSKKNIEKLKSAIAIPEDKIFWAPGNHDIERKDNSYRNQLIANIRSGAQSFDTALQDEEAQMILLRPFKEYLTRNEQLLGYKPQSRLHNFYSCEHFDLIILNTSITSCDTNDNGNLFILDSSLIDCFNQHQNGRPLFVLGHHDISCCNLIEQKQLADRFDHSAVDIYLCGHQHQLSFDNLPGISRDIPQCIVGGGTDIDYCDFSFLVGDYDAQSNSFHISPYVFSKSGNRKWNLEYNFLPRLGENNQIQCCHSNKPQNLVFSISDLAKLEQECNSFFVNTNYSNYCPDTIKNKICNFILIAFNLVIEKVKSKPAKIQDMGKIYNFLLDCELNKDIDIDSIYFLYNHATVSWFEAYRAFFNTCKIVNQLLDQGLSFSMDQLPPFDFSGFYANTDNFNIDNTCYILVTESLHDIPLEQRHVLANMPWNIVIDYDSATDNGGLRQSSRRRNKSIYAQVRNIEEAIFTKEIPLWLTFDNTAYVDIFNGGKAISLGELKIIFRKLATKLKESFSGNCTVVFLKNKEAKDNLLITELFERFADACEFHFISSTYESIKADLDILIVDDYGKPLDNYFAYASNVYSFLASLLEYQNVFPSEFSQSNDEKHSLPTIDGPKTIPENIYINLCDCFEVLTGDIGLDNSNLIDNREKFYKGNIASWDLFSEGDILNIMHPEVYKKYLIALKSSMASKLENPRGHIFTLLHMAGFGGTTLSRQIAWDLHLSHPVLLIHHYYPNKFVQLVRQLYDQHCRTGIFLLADENNLTSTELENIEKESLVIDRPIALLIVKRDRDPARKIWNKRVLRLNVLSYSTIQNLKSRFSMVSSLPKNLINEKIKHFDLVFKKNATPACPFFIGLYFMEKDFEGVESYTKGIIQDIDHTGELETLAILGFVDVYSGLGLPHEMIRKMVALNVKGSYITNYPYASEAFINTLDKSYNISLIKGRHVILSSELFKQCVLKLYNCSTEEKLGYYATKIIDYVSKCCINGVSTYYKDLLEKLFITKYNGDLSATEESFYATDFSNLILSVPTPESKEMVFQKLVDVFTPLVNNLDDQEDKLAYHMLAHFWGHFGRLYRSKELGSFTNYDKSVECCKKAEDIMLVINRNDPYIYHMHGDSISRKCFDWMIKNENFSNDGTSINALDELVVEAIDCFEAAMQYGDIGHSALSTLDLLMAYLKYIFKMKGISSPNDFYKLNIVQLQYKSIVEDYIDLLEEIPKDYRGSQLFNKLKHEFRAEILFNNYGIAIQYYENKIATVKNKQGVDSLEIYQLMRGLSNALMEKYKNSSEGIDGIEKKDAQRITDALEQNIQRTVSHADIYDRRQKSIDCYRWFRYAPYGNSSIAQALVVADKWKYLDGINGHNTTPLPFYYEYVLLVLRLLEGYEIPRMQIQDAMALSYKYAQNTSYSTTQIRNILVEGQGLSRIRPFNSYKSFKKNYTTIKPLQLQGKFTKVYGVKRDSGLGCITITQPTNLKGLEVFFKMGKGNTIQGNQTGHILDFYVGFTCERMVAFDHLVADTTSGETLESKVDFWVNNEQI